MAEGGARLTPTLEAPGTAEARRDWINREYLRLTLALLATPATLGLAWLVVRHEALPFTNVRSAALTTVIFCLLTIGLVLYVHRLPLLSFPSLFLAVTFFFTCSPLILYLLKGSDAFLFWEIVDTRGHPERDAGGHAGVLLVPARCAPASDPDPRPGDGYRR